MNRQFRFDGYNGQGEREYFEGIFSEGKVYEAQEFDYYDGNPHLEPDAKFLDDRNIWSYQNLCFFTEIDVDLVEPSPEELAIMNQSALELEAQFK